MADDILKFENANDRNARLDEKIAWDEIQADIFKELVEERQWTTLICACGDSTTNPDGVCWICASLKD